MEANFRNLSGRPLELWVARLAAEKFAAGHRLLIKAGSPERLRTLDQALWTFDPGSFLPHGIMDGGNAARQPILLSLNDESPNQADCLVVVDQSSIPASSAFHSIDYVFERADPAGRDAARTQWRLWKEQGLEPVYWEAGADGWRRAG